jgi:TPR repeat protein
LRLHRAVIPALSLLLLAWAAMPATAQERDQNPDQIAPNHAPAQPFSAGVAAYDRGDFTKAHEIWLPWAHRGDPAAQRNLAHLYRMGLGVPQNFTQAAAWYRLAADNGLARAQANLGSMYLRGQGVEEDAQQAAYWFTAAAVNNHVLAQHNLALLYLRGEGVERNEAKAAGWLYRAAKAGHKPSMQTLAKLVGIISGPAGPPSPPGRLPVQSKPVRTTSTPPVPPRDGPDPAKPPELAAIGMPATAPQMMDPPAMDPAEFEPAKEDASLFDVVAAFFSTKSETDLEGDREVIPADSPDEAARRNIAAGLVALHAANYATAKARWQPLAEGGHAEAQYQLGKLYLHNGFSEANRLQGFFWLSQAASQQHAGAVASKNALDSVMSQDERVAARLLVQNVARDEGTRP